jgi:hypothetical protein
VTYRDDREALRSQVESLQQELDQARAERDQLAGIEERLEAAKREMAAAEEQLARARGRSTASSRAVWIWVALVLVATGAGLAFWMRQREAPSPVDAHAVPTVPGPPALPPSQAVTPPAAPPSFTAPAPPPRVAHATWSASVTSAKGVPLARGARCTVEADVVPDASGMHVKNVEVRCGATKLYSDRDPLNGMAMVDSGAEQRPGPKTGTWVYDFTFADRGTRAASRSQVQLDSTRKVGRVWSEDLPELRVDLAIAKGSAPVDVSVK